MPSIASHSRTLFFSLLLVLFLGLPWLGNSQPVHAQDDQALARIDQALADISRQIGRTVNRQNSYWTWTDLVYNNASLGCPDPATSYAQVQTRGYSITIEYDGSAYNYRATPDGSIFFQCVDGRPATDDATTPTPVPTLAPDDGLGLGLSTFWAWIYEPQGDVLYLINQNGEVTNFPRPKLPDEAITDAPTANVAISRDSRFMVVSSRLNSDVDAVGIYSFAEGRFLQVHQAQPNEDIQLGFQPGSVRGGSQYIFDSTSQQVAIGFSLLDFENEANSQWRVMIFDLATGNALYQLESTNPELVALLEADQLAFSFPRTVYFGEDTVNIQILPAFGEGLTTYPAVAWHPNGNFIETSPMLMGDMDVLVTSEEIVFPFLSEEFISVEPYGPFVAYNTLATGTLDDPTVIWADGTRVHMAPRWANNGNMVIFRSFGALEDSNPERWGVLDVERQSVIQLDPGLTNLYPLPSGFLSLSQLGAVSAHDPADPLLASRIWQAPDTLTPSIVWASLPGYPFGLESIMVGTTIISLNGNPQIQPTPVGTLIPPTLAPTLPAVAVCAGAPTSRMALGMVGRITFTDGTSTRLRSGPGSSILTLMPEGTPFTVIGGPTCQDNFAWWQIRLVDGQVGWVAEGNANTYFIEPQP